MVICPNCKRTNEDQAKICPYCGQPLELAEHISTRNLEDADFEEGRPQWGTARFDNRTYLTIVVRDTREQLDYVFEHMSELVLGRTDPETGETPEIDLAPHGATEKGVSRRHAIIALRDNQLNLIDLGSPNGSYINGQRVAANESRLLRDGDEIRLGHLVLSITFSRP